MVRWRYCLILAVLLLLPLQIGSDSDEDDQDESGEGGEDANNEGDDDEEEEEIPRGKPEMLGRRSQETLIQTTRVPERTTKKRPLECYVCAHKPDTMLRACLDPKKFRVQVITCHNVDDKCFTSVITKGNAFESVVRGCRSGCVGSPEVTCCEFNRCNNQSLAVPMIEPQALVRENSSAKCFPSSVLFFVTILLVLQTVVKVTFV